MSEYYAYLMMNGILSEVKIESLTAQRPKGLILLKREVTKIGRQTDIKWLTESGHVVTHMTDYE